METKIIDKKLVAHVVVAQNLKITQGGDDYINGTLTVLLESKLKAATVEKKIIQYYVDRPSFLDWFLRRRKVVNIEVETGQFMPKNLFDGAIPYSIVTPKN